ncbi:hypothetical protein BCE33L2091 [Bacillus cereus E33L]|uniref:Uncharacterized protein n=1 Tax=Bacillus cereus (strain ZK / E33L) TaxID=288681 RepID=Q63BN5_BACCZ|nr:hypothetical protein BCE33L2091 [Bacillus cereus E33L]
MLERNFLFYPTLHYKHLIKISEENNIIAMVIMNTFDLPYLLIVILPFQKFDTALEKAYKEK